LGQSEFQTGSSPGGKVREYQLVNEALFRAAARAPLFEARTVGDVSFDPEMFVKIALEESEAEGSA
jgi:hypothetical protein